MKKTTTAHTKNTKEHFVHCKMFLHNNYNQMSHYILIDILIPWKDYRKVASTIACLVYLDRRFDMSVVDRGEGGFLVTITNISPQKMSFHVSHCMSL